MPEISWVRLVLYADICSLMHVLIIVKKKYPHNAKTLKLSKISCRVMLMLKITDYTSQREKSKVGTKWLVECLIKMLLLHICESDACYKYLLRA